MNVAIQLGPCAAYMICIMLRMQDVLYVNIYEQWRTLRAHRTLQSKNDASWQITIGESNNVSIKCQSMKSDIDTFVHDFYQE